MRGDKTNNDTQNLHARSSQRLSLAETISSPNKSPISPLGSSVLPEMFGRYRILKTLGQGAMGIVYLARDTQLDRNVALKVPQITGPDQKELIDRFYREARSAATLHHPNICSVFDVGQIEGTHFISMAYIEGRPLTKYISPTKKQKRVPPQHSFVKLPWHCKKHITMESCIVI